MRITARLFIGLFLVASAGIALAVSALINLVVQLAPMLARAGVIIVVAHLLRSHHRVGAPGAARRGPLDPGTAPGYWYRHHQWGWTRTPQGKWAWVSIWIAQPVPPAHEDVNSEAPHHDRAGQSDRRGRVGRLPAVRPRAVGSSTAAAQRRRGTEPSRSRRRW